MRNANRSRLFWLVSCVVTLLVAFFQRSTGPSHPLKGQEQIADRTVTYKLPRSAETGQAMPVTISAPNFTAANMHFRRINSDDTWTEISMTPAADGQTFTAAIPPQPPAGKVEYRIAVVGDKGPVFLNQQLPVVARFRNPVPAALLALHIALMFSSLLCASRCVFSPWDSGQFQQIMIWTTNILLFLGGMVFGPIVQQYAFGQYWTGFPIGTDLTDNKTLFIVAIWVISLFFYRKHRFFLSATAILTLLVFLIPHSLLGSELDHRSGRHKNLYGSLSNPRSAITAPVHGPAPLCRSACQPVD